MPIESHADRESPRENADGWTACTRGGRLTAHAERTIALARRALPPILASTA